MNKLKELRLARKLSVKEVAKQLNISPSMVYELERGTRNPSFKLAKRICEFYNCSLDEIFLNHINTKRVGTMHTTPPEGREAG